jgi:hypothetical protein
MSFRLCAAVVLLALGFRPGFSWGEERERPAYDWPAMKAVWEQRVRDIRARGVTPIFDVESSYGVLLEDRAGWGRRLASLDGALEGSGIAVVGFEPAWLGALPPARRPWGYAELFAANREAAGRGFSWFLPVPPSGRVAAAPERARGKLFDEVLRDGYPLMGEFYFLRYPNNRDALNPGPGTSARLSVPLDSPAAEEIFSFSQRHGVPFLIHYEVEDESLSRLERMLARYPGAKVIWSHLGRVRFPDRTQAYGPDLIRSMVKRFPNLYFDTSCITKTGRYPLSRALESVIWDERRRHLAPEWKALIEDSPWRFLSALDMSDPGLEPEMLSRKAAEQREFLAELSPRTAQIVAYGAAWKLIFGEDLIRPAAGAGGRGPE